MKPISDNIALNQQQLSDYMALLQLSPKEVQDMLNDFTVGNELKGCEEEKKRLAVLCEEHATATPKRSRKFGVVRNMFSLRTSSSKSDDENDAGRQKGNCHVSSNSLTNLNVFSTKPSTATTVNENKKKAVSLTELSSALDSDYPSDQARTGSIGYGHLKGNKHQQKHVDSEAFTVYKETNCYYYYYYYEDGPDTVAEENDYSRLTNKKYKMLMESAYKRPRSLNTDFYEIDATDRNFNYTLPEKPSARVRARADVNPAAELLNRYFDDGLDKPVSEFNAFMEHCSAIRSKGTTMRPVLKRKPNRVGLHLGDKEEFENATEPKNNPESFTPHVFTDTVVDKKGTMLERTSVKNTNLAIEPINNELEIVISGVKPTQVENERCDCKFRINPVFIVILLFSG